MKFLKIVFKLFLLTVVAQLKLNCLLTFLIQILKKRKALNSKLQENKLKEN